MKGLNSLATALLVIGGLNWALVGLFKFDLVAALSGTRFGRKNKLSSGIYELVGVSALLKMLLPAISQRTSAAR